MAALPETYALPICPACRVSLMWPAGRVWQCDRCGMAKIPHADDTYIAEFEM